MTGTAKYDIMIKESRNQGIKEKGTDDTMDNTTRRETRPRRIRVSGKRQITIPIKFFERFAFGDEIECLPTEEGLLLRPVTDEDKGEFDDDILKDIIREGFTGDDIVEEFKRRKAMIRPAVEKLLARGRSIAEGKAKGYTVEEVFGKGE